MNRRAVTCFLVAVATALMALGLGLLSPGWLRLSGAGPHWLILWLLAWALSKGPVAGVTAGSLLGIGFDTLTIGSATPLYGLALLGYAWGRRGRRHKHGQPGSWPFLAIQASLGSLLLDLTILLQLRLGADPMRGSVSPDAGILPSDVAAAGWSWLDIGTAGLHGTFAAALVTGLLAPVTVALLIQLWQRLDRLKHG